jgi:serine protease Do
MRDSRATVVFASLPLLAIAGATDVLEAREIAFNPEDMGAAVGEILVDGHLACSGFFVAENGTCLTCSHALVGAKKIEVLLADGTRCAAARGGANEGIDAAVLFVALPEGRRVPALRFAAREPSLGDVLYLAASPFYRHRLLLTGTVAGTRSAFEYNPDLKTYVEIFYVTAMTPRGASGSPWLTPSGEVVGLQSGGIARGDNFWGVGFVVPARALRALAEKPAEGGVFGDLGAAVDELWEHPADTIERFSRESSEGLLLSKILRGGACSRAGLAGGALVVGVNGRPCRFREDLLSAVRSRKPGDELPVEVLRERPGKLAREKVILRLGSSAEAFKLAEH